MSDYMLTLFQTRWFWMLAWLSRSNTASGKHERVWSHRWLNGAWVINIPPFTSLGQEWPQKKDANMLTVRMKFKNWDLKNFSVFTWGESCAGWNIQLFPTETGGPETAGPTVLCVQEPKPSPSELALSSFLPRHEFIIWNEFTGNF